ncbi:hypothetical protein P2G88_12825 [Aliiglaciecola sp. CAU 1673]|uniref:hypothetical protein n=1 Tax=Aliiglaciecola sp. CAU 1673 TaxID=3032595 RepID=UPI0023DBAE00|nr:hypothetical protein [Aliiglaciecola sp. CAU 1673]MDF2179136.1 hypothetical protein [Aliiglaciecola sp. CAU 1673]
MSSQSEKDNNLNRWIMQISVVVVFTSLMSFAIWYLHESEPDLAGTTMEMLADRMAKNVVGAKWQWEAEGRPARILQVIYDEQGKEVDRRPIAMSHLGLPRVEPDKKGCNELWRALLNVPMQVTEYKVFAEYYSGEQLTGNALDSTCRFRVSIGPSFDYKIYTGQIKKN